MVCLLESYPSATPMYAPEDGHFMVRGVRLGTGLYKWAVYMQGGLATALANALYVALWVPVSPAIEGISTFSNVG